MSTYLTTENYAQFINTGSEVTAQNLADEHTSELFLGVGETAYMYKEDAERLLSADELEATTSVNPLFVHIDDATLFHLLRREQYFISDEG